MRGGGNGWSETKCEVRNGWDGEVRHSKLEVKRAWRVGHNQFHRA